MIKDKVIAAVRAVFTTLAFSLIYPNPVKDLVSSKAPEILINLRMSLSPDYFQVSVLAIAFYIIYSKFSKKTKESRAFKVLCALFALVWVMCYALSLEDTLDIMYCTKGQIVKTILMLVGTASFLDLAGSCFFDFLKWGAERPYDDLKKIHSKRG